MFFYKFSHNSFYTRGYTWAYSWKNSSEYTKICPMCNSPLIVYPDNTIHLTVEGGIKYPDILGCGEYPFLIVSENMINDWERFGITGYKKYKADIVEVKGKRIKDIEPPKYYHIDVIGRAEYDLNAMKCQISIICNNCKRIQYLDSSGKIINVLPDSIIFKNNSWDGSDLFVDSLTPRYIFCTNKILNLAGINERTNCRFVPLDDKDPVSNKGLDYKAIAKKMLRDKRNPLER